MAHRSDADYIQNERDTARFFVENRQVSGILLLATFALGIYGYTQMPKRKDPDIPVRVASVQTQWPGATAEQVEQLVTGPIESSIAQNPNIRAPKGGDFGIKSLSIPGLSIIQVQLSDSVKDSKKEFSDMNLKLNSLSLPQGAGPIKFNSDFGDTAALMLTVASPLEDPTAIAVRGYAIEAVLGRVRKERRGKASGVPVSLIYCYPLTVPQEAVQRNVRVFIQSAEARGILSQAQFVSGPGFAAVDGFTKQTDAEIYAYIKYYVETNVHESEIHPDTWPPVVVHDPSNVGSQLAAAPGNKYTYRQLDQYTDLLSRTILGAPEVSRVDRNGVLQEQIYLDYSQERLASYGLQPSNLKGILNARNITLPGGALETGSKNILVDPSGEFTSTADIGNVIVGTSTAGSALYLRDLVDIRSGYQSPARYLNYYTWRDGQGKWQRTRAVTLAVQMRRGSRSRSLRSTCRTKSRDEEVAAVGFNHCGYIRSAPAGERERRPIHGCAVRGDRAGGDRIAHRILGMAIGSADGDFDSDHTGNDVWIRSSAGHRYSAGFSRDIDYRARASGGRSRGGRRLDQALAGRWPSTGDCGLARTNQAGACDFVRNESRISSRTFHF